MRKMRIVFGLWCILAGTVAQAATTHVVQVGNNFFNPSSPSILRGDTIKWVWVSGFHTTTSGIRNTAGAGSLWDKPIDASHRSFSRVFSAEGSFPYFCAFHLGMSGTITVTALTGVLDEPATTAARAAVALDQNIPNPFNAETVIPYTLRASGHASLIVANILGQTVRRLLEANQPAGSYSISWDGRDDTGLPVASGVYFYRLQAGNESMTRKMVMLR